MSAKPTPSAAELVAARKAIRAGALSGMKFKDFMPQRELVREILGQSLPQTLSMLTMSLGTFVITYSVAKFGTNAVAAYGAGLRVEQIGAYRDTERACADS